MGRVKSSKRKKGPGQGQVTEGEGELKELKRCIVKSRQSDDSPKQRGDRGTPN